MVHEKSLIREAFNKLKEKLFCLFITQLIFLSLNLFYMILLKQNMQAYLINLQSISPSIESILNTTDKAMQNTQLEQILANIEPSTQTMMFFLFIVTPIVLILIWTIFQGLIWKIINNKKLNIMKYLQLCLIPTILSFIIIISTIYTTVNLIINIIVIAIVYYFLAIFYNLQEDKKIISTIKESFILGIRKFFSIAPYILIMFISSLALFWVFLILLLKYTINELFSLSSFTILLYLCVLIILNLFLKVVVSLKINQK